MKKINQKKGLSATVSMFMTLAVCHSVSVQASDIDIYSNSTGGQTRIMFVLDRQHVPHLPLQTGTAAKINSNRGRLKFDLSFTANIT